MINNIDKIMIEVPEDAQWIIQRLSSAGFEAYAVGGCVRDSLLGRVPYDWDITTSALPEQVKSLFRSTVDTGIKHGTVTVIKNGAGYEVTTYRKDGEYKDGRHPESVTFTGTLADDLMRRDFTINAMAYNHEQGLVDLFGGITDLNQKIVRAVGNPDDRFEEDALRIMRAIRFAAQLGFRMDRETYDSIEKHADNLAKVSMERIRVEFEKTLMSNHPDYIFLFGKLGMGKYIVPGFQEECFTADREERKKLLNSMGGKKELRLSVFLSELNPEDVHSSLRKLTYDNKTNNAVTKIITYKDCSFTKDRIQLKLLLHEMGTETFEWVLKYREARLKALGTEPQELLDWVKKEYSDILEKKEVFAVEHLEVRGRDLIEAGIPKGEPVGIELENLVLAVIKEPGLNTKETLTEMIKQSAKQYAVVKKESPGGKQ